MNCAYCGRPDVGKVCEGCGHIATEPSVLHFPFCSICGTAKHLERAEGFDPRTGKPLKHLCCPNKDCTASTGYFDRVNKKSDIFMFLLMIVALFLFGWWMDSALPRTIETM